MLAPIGQDDRRGARRYPCRIDIRLEQQTNDGALRVGQGVTEDFSRRGLRFRAETPLEVGAEIVTRIAWPILLQNTCQLELVVQGRVTRVTDRGTIVSIRSYEFRTCGPRSFWQAPPLSSNAIVA